MTAAARAKRLMYLIHRWTGVATCILMVLWLLSGLVMLFVGYPKFSLQERLRALPPLAAPACCVPVEVALAHSQLPTAVQQIALTSIANVPHYRMKLGNGRYLMVDARTGLAAPPVDAAQALASARAFLPHAPAKAQVEDQMDDDRWSHSGALNAHRPLFRVRMHDEAGSLLYVSSTTGEVVMDTTRHERGWNYVGAWLHWLYMFRDGAKDPIWSWLVIGLSAVGTASAVSGALVGIWRWRFSGRYKSGSKTPYREFQMHWHHITGLVFGFILLAWMFSGLMSMNPLGVFDAKGERPNLAAYRQGEPGAIRPTLSTQAALALLANHGFVPSEIEWRVLGGSPYLLARNAAGASRLIVQSGGSPQVLARWPDEVLARAGARLMASGVDSVATLQQHDRFYFQRKDASMYGAAERRLPVVRLNFSDSGKTSVYLDPATGDVALSVDDAQRLGRWLFNLLHSWDLPAFLRHALAREAALIVLSLGALAIAITGLVIGYRRLRMFVGQARSGKRRHA